MDKCERVSLCTRVCVCVCLCWPERLKVNREYINPVSMWQLSVQSRFIMLHPAVLCVLLACAVSLGTSAVILENGMPILWAQTAGQVTDLPIQDGILTPDPWHYLHRMSLYRLMIAATDPFMGSMGTNSTDSPLWGLPLQLGWMLTSGTTEIHFFHRQCFPRKLRKKSGFIVCFLLQNDSWCKSGLVSPRVNVLTPRSAKLSERNIIMPPATKQSGDKLMPLCTMR